MRVNETVYSFKAVNRDGLPLSTIVFSANEVSGVVSDVSIEDFTVKDLASIMNRSNKRTRKLIAEMAGQAGYDGSADSIHVARHTNSGSIHFADIGRKDFCKAWVKSKHEDHIIKRATQSSAVMLSVIGAISAYNNNDQVRAALDEADARFPEQVSALTDTILNGVHDAIDTVGAYGGTTTNVAAEVSREFISDITGAVEQVGSMPSLWDATLTMTLISVGAAATSIAVNLYKSHQENKKVEEGFSRNEATTGKTLPSTATLNRFEKLNGIESSKRMQKLREMQMNHASDDLANIPTSSKAVSFVPQ